MIAMKRIVLRSWRVVEAEPSGFFVWYDPTREGIELYELEPPKDSGVVAFSEGDDQIDAFPALDPSDTHRDPLDGLPF